jgi:bifunctional DNA-binding transcriptional regulator/antitoxin component of YhaV-PrlF toxin-antitoxin module
MSEFWSFHSVIDEGGGFAIPDRAREALGLRTGDTLVAECDGHSLLVRRADSGGATTGASEPLP